MNLYEVKLIWRYRPQGRRPYYVTQTVGVTAETAFGAACHAALRLLPDCVENVRAKVKHQLHVANGEPTRRCKGDRWDGYPPGDFLPVTVWDGGTQCHDAKVLR